MTGVAENDAAVIVGGMDLIVQVPDDASPKEQVRLTAAVETLVVSRRLAGRAPKVPLVQDVPDELVGELTLGADPVRLPEHALSQRVQLRARLTNVGAVIVWDHRPGPFSGERLRVAPGRSSGWIVVGHHGARSLWVAGEHPGDRVGFVSSRAGG